jgi:hypothetical protein
MAEEAELGANSLGGARRGFAGFCGSGARRAFAQVYEGARRVETAIAWQWRLSYRGSDLDRFTSRSLKGFLCRTLELL